MIHLGDITKLRGSEVPIVDVVTGGSPCQDLSVAGKRAGLDGERSGLFMEQIRIVKEMREHDRNNGRPVEFLRPRYVVWENVPGAFSSNGGKDFQAVLTEFARVADPEAPDVPMPEKGKWPKSGCLYDEMGRWSIAWRVHDAQFWGVPQRRKRIALVADFGGLSASEILFERKGLRWHPEPGGEERQGAADRTEDSSGNAICYGFSSFDSNAMKSPNPHSGIYEAETSRTLDLNGGNPACNQGGVGVLGLNDQGGSVMNVSEDVSGALRAQEHGHQPAVHVPCVVEPLCIEMTSTKNTIVDDGISPTLTARMGTGGNQVNAVCLDVGFFSAYEEVAPTALSRQYKDPPVVMNDAVGTFRRLTPLECERLQGFPDDWTDIGDWTDSNGKKHKAADSPRYKALGNSIALPFWQYLARRICAQYERSITMASLFDGIGGFPLVFERCGAKAVWASEIEEFPMAVTKIRFKEE